MTIMLAVMLSLKDLAGAMDQLKDALENKAAEFFDVLKMGRTANQDAVPINAFCKTPPHPSNEQANEFIA